jgi:hypothetical protein
MMIHPAPICSLSQLNRFNSQVLNRPHLHQFSDKEQAAWLQASAIKLHDVAVVELGQGLHLLEEQLQLLAAGAGRLEAAAGAQQPDTAVHCTCLTGFTGKSDRTHNSIPVGHT